MTDASALDFRQKLLAMLGLCFVLAMVALDQTVIGTALPTVVADLHGFDLYAWVGTAYLLTSVITVPVFGKLGDEHGRRPFILAAIALFTLASMLCGLAQSMLQLVLARALQGIGGGMLVATTFASVPDLFPEARERLRWQILFSSAFGIANAVGPSLGGYLTEYWGWRWVFFVNLPVGLASLAVVWLHLPRIRHSQQPPSRLDWLGSLLVAATLGCLQLLVEWLPLHKPAALLLALAAAGGASGLALFWWERRCPNPVLPLSLFAGRGLAPLFALSLTVGFCMFSVTYYAPLLFQGGFGLSPNRAGLLITPLAVSITLGSITNGRIVTRLESANRMLYIGLGLFWLTALALTQTSAATPRPLIAGVMALGGLGLGMLLPNITLFVQASAPRTQLGVATAMLQSMRMVGGMLGMALGGTLVSRIYAHGVDRLLADGDGARWSSWLEDPQILVNRGLAERFTAAAGHDAAMWLAGARDALVNAIHSSQWVVVVVMLLALWLVRRVPPINLHHRPVAVEAAHE
ncbi:MAG TPA: MDR family MFS transporter [Rhodocyclaceae bacterium]|nr:MDR family MFS transporter [Rhodocyclaceae bacterium]